MAATVSQHVMQTSFQPGAGSNQVDPILIPESLRYMPLPTEVDLNPATNSTITRQIAKGASPCRRCLKDADEGDELLLVSWDPWLNSGAGPSSFDTKSPYSCRSPIFLHADRAKCDAQTENFPKTGGGVLPDQQRTRMLAVRAYDKDDRLKEYAVVQGEHLIKVCEDILVTRKDEVGASYIHVYYAGPGCFAVRVEPS